MSEGNRTQWGWHCLADSCAEDLVRSSNVGRDDLVLDVGAGTGALAAPLAASGAQVIAIELHPRRVAELRRRFASNSRVKVVRADATSLWLPKRPFRVVANPPFSITAALLNRLLERHSALVSAHLVVQRVAARRYGVGRVVPIYESTHYFDLRVDRLLPRSAFVPRPAVDVAVLAIERVPRNLLNKKGKK